MQSYLYFPSSSSSSSSLPYANSSTPQHYHANLNWHVQPNDNTDNKSCKVGDATRLMNNLSVNSDKTSENLNSTWSDLQNNCEVNDKSVDLHSDCNANAKAQSESQTKTHQQNQQVKEQQEDDKDEDEDEDEEEGDDGKQKQQQHYQTTTTNTITRM